MRSISNRTLLQKRRYIIRSLARYRNQQRIERFLRLQKSGAEPFLSGSLLSAALEAGFGSYAQFFRVFSEVMGCSPTAFAKSLSSRRETSAC